MREVAAPERSEGDRLHVVQLPDRAFSRLTKMFAARQPYFEVPGVTVA